MSKQSETEYIKRMKKDRVQREVQFFQKHVIEGKSLSKSSKEMGLSTRVCVKYKAGQNFHQMATAHLDEQIGGVKGTVSKLVELFNAERPITLLRKVTKKDGSIVEKQEIEWVADNNTRDKALKKVIDIYGLNAPKQTDVNVAVSFSSDAELFAEIDEVARSSKYVQSYETGENGFELAKDPSGASGGDFESRQRTLLQGAPIPEPVGREPELAVQDTVEPAEA